MSAAPVVEQWYSDQELGGWAMQTKFGGVIDQNPNPSNQLYEL